MSSPKPKRGRPRLSDRVQAPDMRDVILAEAGTLLRLHGPDNTSMAAIAKASGVTAPALYWHFSSKEELLFEFLKQTWADFAAFIKSHRSEAESPRQRLFQTAYAHTKWQLENVLSEADLALAQMIHSLNEGRRDEIRELQRTYLADLVSILNEGVQAEIFSVEHPRIAARAIVNICEYSAQWYRVAGKLSFDDIAQYHARLVMRMVESHHEADVEPQ